MRLILSRKGFDSACGGVASPVFPDGRMVTLPIPRAGAPVRFGALRWHGGSLGALVAGLSRGRLGADDPAHLDPDLWRNSLARRAGWRGAFGQVGAAQTHLAAQGVGVGDVFVFFGWFRAAVPYVRRGWRLSGPDMHAAFGWLQVGAVLRPAVDRPPAGLDGHPHWHGSWAANNTVYVAAERLVVGGRVLGAGSGVFGRFHSGLQLTAAGRGRSVWRVPGWMGTELSFHGDPGRWERDGDGWLLRTVSQGQEFVLPCTGREGEAADWLAGLLAGAGTDRVPPKARECA